MTKFWRALSSHLELSPKRTKKRATMIRQSRTKGIKRYKLTICIDEKLVPKIFDLAEDMNFSKSLTVNTLLAIELGVDLNAATAKEDVFPFIPQSVASSVSQAVPRPIRNDKAKRR